MMRSRLSQAQHGNMRLPQDTLGNAAMKLKMKLGVLVRSDHNQFGLFLPSDIQNRSHRVSQGNAKGQRDVAGERSHALKLFAAIADCRAIFVQQFRVRIAVGTTGRRQDMNHDQFGKLIAGNTASDLKGLVGVCGKVCGMQDDIERVHGGVLQAIENGLVKSKPDRL